MHNRTRSRASHRCVLSLAFAAGILYTCLPFARAADVQIIAHRGGYLDTPENTRAAFRACAGLVDRIEFDVRVSSDGHLVVIHDDTVTRTTTGFGEITAVAALTLEQLQALDAGVKCSPVFAGERIPTLAEALRSLPPGVSAIVDRKTGSPQAIVQTLRDENAIATAMVASFDFGFLKDVHALEPALPLCYLYSGPVSSTMLATLQRFSIGSLGWDKRSVSAAGIDLIHSFGMQALVWPLSSPEIQSFQSLGADGLIVDNPRSARAGSADTPSSNAQLSRALHAYWKLDDNLTTPQALTAADVEDRCLGRLQGFSPSPTWLPAEEARAGEALRLDGINDRVILPASPAMEIGTNAVTLSLWVKLDTLPSGLSTNFASIYDSDIDAYALYLDQAANELRFKVTDASSHAARPGIPAANLRTGAWHHVVGIFDGAAGRIAGQAAIYLDGRIQDIHTGHDYAEGFGLTNAVLPGQTAAIGRNGTANNCYFSGAVDEVALWRRPLSSAEVRQIYEAGTNGAPLERSVMLLWIDNVYPDLQTGEMQLDLRVEHGSLTNQPLRLRGAAVAHGSYVECATLEGGRGKAPHFRVPQNLSVPGPAKINAPPAFFQVVLP